MSSTDLSHRLARSFSKLRPADLPGRVVHEMKRRILDALGCALGAVGSPPALAAARVARAHAGGRHPVSMIGQEIKTSCDIGAFYNGTLIRYLDFNDTYLSKEPCHPSDNLAAALATAEAFGSSGKELITALAGGYEVLCRLCDAASLRRRGWDHVTYGTLSASLMASKLMGFDPVRASHALAISVVPHAALRQTRAGELSMWKACAFANAGRNGIFAALLAGAGLTGPSGLFGGRFGFFRQVSGPFSWRDPDWRRGPWRLLRSSIKFFPAEYHAQSAIWAALRLRERMSPGRKIESIRIDTFEAAASIIGSEREKWRPESRETADHSLPYLTAVALLDGKVGPGQFTLRRLRDPALRRLVARVRIREDRTLTAAYSGAIPNRVTVRAGGKNWTEEVRYPRGHWRNPMTDAEVEAKFFRQAAPFLGRSRSERVRCLVWRLDRLPSVRPLMKLLAGHRT